MKSISIIVTKEDAERSVRFYRLWTIIFLLLTIFSIFIGNIIPNFFFYIIGLFLALVPLYLNYKDLKTRRKIVSKTTTDLNSIKNSLLYLKIVSIFWLILAGSILVIIIIAQSEMVIGFLFLFMFILTQFYRRMKLFSHYLRKKR